MGLLGRRGFGECCLLWLAGYSFFFFGRLWSVRVRTKCCLLIWLLCSFFFADERKADGGPVGSKPDADGHARFYLSLVEDDEVPYYATFLDGKYKEFP